MTPKHRFALVAAATLVAVTPARPESFLDKFKEAGSKLQQQLQPAAPPTAAAPRPASAAAAVTVAKGPAVRYTRSADALRALMLRGDVPGDELITELKAMQIALRQQRSAAAITALGAGLDHAAASVGKPGSFDWGSVLGRLGKQTVDALVKEATGRVAYGALDDLLLTLSADGSLLGRESVKLPSPQGMTEPQMQRVVTMAALVVAVRATKKLYEQAQKDIASIEDDYKGLIDRREKAAALLYEAVAARAQAQRDGNAKAQKDAEAPLALTLSANERAFLEADLSRLDAKAFVNDIAAQNLALNFLRARDPAAFDDYKARRDGTLARTRAYLKTTAGAAAMGGLSAGFVSEVQKTVDERNAGQILTLLPFGIEFVREATPLMKLAAETTGSALEAAAKSTQRFRIAGADGETALRDADAVFSAIKGKDAERLFAESLFRQGQAGLLQRVHVCDGPETGRLLDTAVERREREQFASAWFGSQVPSEGFQFVNAFTPRPKDAPVSKPERELADRLLKTDLRGQRDDTLAPLVQLQERVAANFRKWDSEQLMRLIFANREGSASLATLQLGEVSLRPVPSMESIYVYESLIKACTSLVAPAGLQPPAKGTGKPPARPGRTADAGGNR